jgi:ABC-type Mn2+/Zn2+ transport system ATPase subunit
VTDRPAARTRPRTAGPNDRPDGSLLLRARGLAIGYDRDPVLRDLEFEVHAGERVGVIGPNGGGKTTLIRAVLGELRPLWGTLEVWGRPALVPQAQRARLDYPVTALDVALMGALARVPWWQRLGRAGRGRAMEALERVGLAERSRTPFGDLSGGQQQRVLFARALVQDGDMLLLDEPFTGVDRTSEERLLRVIEEESNRGRAVVIAIHDLEPARTWERVLSVNGRQVAFGPPEVALSPAVLEETYSGAAVLVHQGHVAHRSDGSR